MTQPVDPALAAPALAGAALPRRRPRSRLTPRQAENRAAYFFLAPWFLGLVLITLGPTFVSLYLSFTRYNILRPPRWVGLENYVEMFTQDPQFWAAVRVTFFYVGWTVPLVLLMSLAVATVLNRGLAGLAIYRSLFYIPSLIGGQRRDRPALARGLRLARHLQRLARALRHRGAELGRAIPTPRPGRWSRSTSGPSARRW